MVAPRPVVKWAGGKTRLLDRLLARLPKGHIHTYAEPFFGGGAMFFALAAEKRFDRAILADKNAELVALYQAIKEDVRPLIERVREYSEEHLRRDDEKRREHFYAVRGMSLEGLTRVERGARLLFLNKTCFNGLWRVNAAGRFNVPFGKYATPRIFDADVLLAAHEALSRATIHLADFADVTKELEKGDFAYFDPPYVPVSKTANFTAYASDRFGDLEQKRLAKELMRLKKKKVDAMLSNAATVETRELYDAYPFYVTSIQAARAINSDPSKRGEVEELVVTTYETDEPAPAKPSKTTKTPKTARPAPRRRAAV